MTTIPHILGEPGTLGFPVDQPDGTPMPLDDLLLRLIVYLPGADLTIPGWADSGEFMFPDGPRDHPSIAAFDMPADLPLMARAYRCAVQIDAGSGWRTLEAHTHIIDVRRP